MNEELISVGIDIGTSTTQLVFSKLELCNMASAFSVPRIEIVSREIIYKSNIYLTPLVSSQKIDIQKVKEIIAGEYELAGIKYEDISTGAAIITGETARKENAKEVLEKMSLFAGDFVVATAGPDLEGVIAGKGAGANLISKKENKNILNIDIGGGTSNLALFSKGEILDTGCFDIGGRLIKFDQGTKCISYISEKLLSIIKKENIRLTVGEPLIESELERITDIMADVLVQSAGYKEKGEYYELLITNKGIKEGEKIDGVTFSGGVGKYIYDFDETENFKYGDIGLALAAAIRKTVLCREDVLHKSNETIRATVIGAGAHTTSLTGSTIMYTENDLPIKNIPVIKIPSGEQKTKETIREAIKLKLEWFREESEDNVVIALEGEKSPEYERVNEFANGIIEGCEGYISKDVPLIIIIENDMGKVLGQTISGKFNNDRKIICLDGLKLEDGDYVDIGNAVADGMALTVVIKTLVF